MLEGRVADQSSGNRLVRNGEAYCQFDQAVGMPFSDQRFEPPRALDIYPVGGARADWLDARRAERVARLDPAQRAGGEHADGDDTHRSRTRMRQEIAEIMRRKARRDCRPGAGIEQVIADLRGVEDARVRDLVQRRGVADRCNAIETGLSLLAQAL